MDPARRAEPSAARQGAGLLRSSAASLLSGVVSVALARAAYGLLAGTSRTLDSAVGGAVLGIGAAAAAMLAAGCLLLAVTAVRRLAGRTSRRLEAFAARLTPLVVRRALAVTISAGLGLGVATVPAAATEPDAGWAVTTATASSTSVGANPSTALPPPAGAESHGVDPSTGTPGPAVETTSGTSGAAADLAADAADAASTVVEASGPTAHVPIRSSGPDLSGAWAPTVQMGTSPEVAVPGAAVPEAADPDIAASRPEVTDPSGDPRVRAATPDEPVGVPATATSENTLPAPTSPPEVQAAAATDAGLPPVHEPATPAPPPAPSPSPGSVTVVAGDTLWSIAAAHLPAGATAQDVARAWPEWYARNQAAIGSDPGLIRPGQTLEAPAAQSSEERA